MLYKKFDLKFNNVSLVLLSYIYCKLQPNKNNTKKSYIGPPDPPAILLIFTWFNQTGSYNQCDWEIFHKVSWSLL